MNKLKIFILILLASAGLGGCIKNEEVIYNDATLEFDATTWNANAVGVNYPILTRVPPFGRAVNTTVDASLTKASGTVKVRVNLVGPQKSTDTEVTYQVLQPQTTAVAGTHYVALPGKVIIPANTSFGDINLQLLSTAGAPPASVDIVLEITGGTNGAKVNPNYSKVGLRIAL